MHAGAATAIAARPTREDSPRALHAAPTRARWRIAAVMVIGHSLTQRTSSPLERPATVPPSEMGRHHGGPWVPVRRRASWRCGRAASRERAAFRPEAIRTLAPVIRRHSRITPVGYRAIPTLFAPRPFCATAFSRSRHGRRSSNRLWSPRTSNDRWPSAPRSRRPVSRWAADDVRRIRSEHVARPCQPDGGGMCVVARHAGWCLAPAQGAPGAYGTSAGGRVRSSVTVRVATDAVADKFDRCGDN